MTQEERRDRFVEDQEQMERSIASGKSKGDFVKDGKPVRTDPRRTYALIAELTRLDVDVAGHAAEGEQAIK